MTLFQENPECSLRTPHQLAPSNKLSKRKFSPSLTSYAITAEDEQTYTKVQLDFLKLQAHGTGCKYSHIFKLLSP